MSFVVILFDFVHNKSGWSAGAAAGRPSAEPNLKTELFFTLSTFHFHQATSTGHRGPPRRDFHITEFHLPPSLRPSALWLNRPCSQVGSYHNNKVLVAGGRPGGHSDPQGPKNCGERKILRYKSWAAATAAPESFPTFPWWQHSSSPLRGTC